MIDIQNDDELVVLKSKLADPANVHAIELLKQASIDADFDDIVDSAFADAENRKFPIFSPEMATISALYMQDQDVDPLVKEACDNSLREWDIQGISTTMLNKEASVKELPIEMFLLPSKKKLPVVDKETLEKSASALSGYFGQLSVSDKVEACSNLYKRATTEFGIKPEDLGEDVIRYAQEAACDLHKLAMSVNERSAETGYKEYAPMIRKIASLKEELGGSISFDKNLNSGIALELFTLDKQANALDLFDAVYDVFNTPFLKEDPLEKVATIETFEFGGQEIGLNKLADFSLDEVKDIMGDSASEIFDGENITQEKLDTFQSKYPSSATRDLANFISSK